MRDIDDSFEEKYNKLRSIAVRLKKKISEQTKRIEELEQASPSSTTETDSSVIPAKHNDAQPLRNLQQLQKQNDTLQDELDALREADKRNVDQSELLSNQLIVVTRELEEIKLINENIKTSVEANRSQKSSLDQAVKEYVKQIAALKEELEVVEKEKKEISDDCKNVKGKKLIFFK